MASKPPLVTSLLDAADAAPAVTARLATTTADRLAAFKLRYEVYIAEQGKPYPEANHEDRLLSDDLDVEGDIIVAESKGEIVGTVRSNALCSPRVKAHYHNVFEVSQLPQIETDNSVVCSRLAASSEHRHANARSLLFEKIYEHRLIRGTRYCFATCAPILVRMFRRYGFREYAAPVHDAVVGTLHRTLLVLDDLQHLRSINSPFVPIAVRHCIEGTSRPVLNQLFDNYKASRAHAGTAPVV